MCYLPAVGLWPRSGALPLVGVLGVLGLLGPPAAAQDRVIPPHQDRAIAALLAPAKLGAEIGPEVQLTGLEIAPSSFAVVVTSGTAPNAQQWRLRVAVPTRDAPTAVVPDPPRARWPTPLRQPLETLSQRLQAGTDADFWSRITRPGSPEPPAVRDPVRDASGHGLPSWRAVSAATPDGPPPWLPIVACVAALLLAAGLARRHPGVAAGVVGLATLSLLAVIGRWWLLGPIADGVEPYPTVAARTYGLLWLLALVAASATVAALIAQLRAG